MQAKEPSACTRRTKPLLMVDIDGVISLFGVRPLAPRRVPAHGRGLVPLDRRHTPLPFVHRRRSPADARRACSSWSGRAAGRRRPTNTSPTCSACPPGCRSCASALAGVGSAQRPLEARGDRRLRGRAAAGMDRRRVQRRLPRVGRGAPGADAARADRPRARPHVAGGAAAGGVGAGALAGGDVTGGTRGHVQRASETDGGHAACSGGGEILGARTDRRCGSR